MRKSSDIYVSHLKDKCLLQKDAVHPTQIHWSYIKVLVLMTIITT